MKKPIGCSLRVGEIRVFEKGVHKGVFAGRGAREFAKEFLQEEEQGSSTGATLGGKGEDPLGGNT